MNELARTLSRGIPLYPIMVESCEPPLSIARLQWLDMQDCLPLDDRPERYRQALSRLLKALEVGQVEPTGKWAWFRKQFGPISFEAEMKPHLAHFVGRQWVLDEIQAWLADPEGSSIFRIIAEPGVGKTALATQLCHRLKGVLAFHSSKFGHSLKIDARKCVLSPDLPAGNPNSGLCVFLGGLGSLPRSPRKRTLGPSPTRLSASHFPGSLVRASMHAVS